MSSRVREMTSEELRAELVKANDRLGSRHGRTALEALDDAEALTKELLRRQHAICEACETATCWCRNCGAPCSIGCECNGE